MNLRDNDVDYKSIAAAKMARWEPALDSYNRKCLSDGIPQYKKNEIDQFHHQRNEISLNKKYHTTRCHPIYPRETQNSPLIYRYETWNELWAHFQQDRADIATKIINPNNPQKWPGLFCHYAPWEMVKGTDLYCLCKNC